MKITILAIFLTICSSVAMASQMTFGFQNPQFGDDPSAWSTHQLTVESTEYARKQAQAAQKKADDAAAAAAAQNTNLAKFMNNLESRIYAQLSLQMSNAMFSGTATTGSLDFQGTTINWVKDSAAQTITLNIIDPNGNATNIVVPIGSFAF
jgi:hypothetical protein